LPDGQVFGIGHVPPGLDGSAVGSYSRFMSESVLFVGTYAIPEGGVDAFREQVERMTALVREHEPRVLAIGHYVNADGTEGTSIHWHPDSDSFDFHMLVAARAIDTGTQTVMVKRIEFYGSPSEDVLRRLSAAFDVQVKTWVDGEIRLGPGL
jgi:hypothetical protein